MAKDGQGLADCRATVMVDGWRWGDLRRREGAYMHGSDRNANDRPKANA